MNTEQVAQIDAATDITEALSLTGKLQRGRSGPDAHYNRLDYIKAKRGYRAVGGYFNATRANVTAKFRKVWSEETGRDPFDAKQMERIRKAQA